MKMSGVLEFADTRRRHIMPDVLNISVPRYVYRSVERALLTAKNRARLAAKRVERLEDTLATMRIGNGSEANDNERVVVPEEDEEEHQAQEETTDED
jgi:hypothetical protein